MSVAKYILSRFTISEAIELLTKKMNSNARDVLIGQLWDEYHRQEARRNG